MGKGPAYGINIQVDEKNIEGIRYRNIPIKILKPKIDVITIDLGTSIG